MVIEPLIFQTKCCQCCKHSLSTHLLAPPYTNICFRIWSSNRKREAPPPLYSATAFYSLPCPCLFTPLHSTLSPLPPLSNSLSLPSVFFAVFVLLSLSVFALRLFILTLLSACLSPEVNHSLVVVGLFPILCIPLPRLRLLWRGTRREALVLLFSFSLSAKLQIPTAEQGDSLFYLHPPLLGSLSLKGHCCLCVCPYRDFTD